VRIHVSKKQAEAIISTTRKRSELQSLLISIPAQIDSLLASNEMLIGTMLPDGVSMDQFVRYDLEGKDDKYFLVLTEKPAEPAVPAKKKTSIPSKRKRRR
jgi:hypothetical protein